MNFGEIAKTLLWVFLGFYLLRKWLRKPSPSTFTQANDMKAWAEENVNKDTARKILDYFEAGVDIEGYSPLSLKVFKAWHEELTYFELSIRGVGVCEHRCRLRPPGKFFKSEAIFREYFWFKEIRMPIASIESMSVVFKALKDGRNLQDVISSKDFLILKYESEVLYYKNYEETARALELYHVGDDPDPDVCWSPRLAEKRFERLDIDYEDVTEEERKQLEKNIIEETALENFEYGVLEENDVLLPNGEVLQPQISEIDIAGYMVTNGPTFYDYTDNRSISYFSKNHELVLKLKIRGEDPSFEDEMPTERDLCDALELIICSRTLGDR